MQSDSVTNQNCALITKVDPISNLVHIKEAASFPLPDTRCFGDNPIPADVSTGHSKHLVKNYVARFQVSGIPLMLFGVHLLAQPKNPLRCVQREAQALVLNNYLANQPFTKVYPEVIVLGDMNDFDSDAPYAGQAPSSRVLEIIKGGPLFKWRNRWPLTNVLEKVPEQTRFTSAHGSTLLKTGGRSRPILSSIDHALVSQATAASLTLAQVASVYKAWGENRCSDHYPVKFVVDVNTLRQKFSLPRLPVDEDSRYTLEEAIPDPSGIATKGRFDPKTELAYRE